MSSNSYVLDMESKIYTLVKSVAYPILVEKYPKIRFTTSDENSENPIFPTVYIYEDSSSEQDRDLDNSHINSVTSVFKVRITVDTDKQDILKIMSVILDTFKEFRFSMIAKSKVVTNANMQYQDFAFRRKIASEDII